MKKRKTKFKKGDKVKHKKDPEKHSGEIFQKLDDKPFYCVFWEHTGRDIHIENEKHLVKVR